MKERAPIKPVVRLLLTVVTAVALFSVSSRFQAALNTDRATLGLTRVTPLKNAPPVLAFTTVALGGFRGLIANALWIRANDLQNDGKYFEMVQLADWITKLEPTFTQVWIVQAWNMAYNISVKFTDYSDRWRWVQRGIELLRDEGIRYNPTEALMYRELAWFFQHKMGQNMDDAHNFYKAAWAKEMTELFGGPKPNFDELLNPRTDQAQQRVRSLREKYRMDPQVMKEIDDRYGPLEWRLPEAHAIYWAVVGWKQCTKKDLITLRRVIYQSMHIAVLRGRISYIESNGRVITSPNLDLVPRAHAAYEEMLEEDTEMRDGITRAHRNFLREVVYLFYSYNRLKDGEFWLRQVRQKYPDAIPPNLTLEEYAFDRLKENLPSMNRDRTAAVLEGMLVQYYFSVAIDDDDRADGLDRMARQLWTYYDGQAAARADALKFPPLQQMKKTVLDGLMDPQSGLLPEIRERLRKKLNLPEPAAVKPQSPTPAQKQG